MKMYKSLLCMAIASIAAVHSAQATPGNVVISQVYGGAGCGTAGCSTYGNDFVELYNRSGSPVSLNGWSIQYQSATGTGLVTNITALPNFTLQPGQYFLVGEGGNANGVNPIPTADATGTISMSATVGKVMLVSSTTALNPGTTCAWGPTLVDLVGFGTTANCHEGTGNTGAPSTTSAVVRKNGGCQDTDDNAADFLVQAPNPRNSTFGAPGYNPCSSSTPPTGTGSSLPTTLCPGSSVTFTVNANGGTNPAGNVVSVTGDFSAIGLTATETFTHGTGSTWTYSIPSFPNVAANTYNFLITINDDQSRSGSASVSLVVTSCSPTIASGTGASPSGVCDGATTTLTVVAIPGQNPTSVVPMTVTADLSGIGGPNPATFSYAGSNTYTYVATVATGTTVGSHSLPFTITDDQARTATGTLTIVSAPCTPAHSQVVISQVYGGGGNSGSTLKNDFVELFNRSTFTANLEGCSIQYSPVDGTSGGFGGGTFNNNPVPLHGSIPPGGYYLIKLSQGTGGSVDLPTPDLIPDTANLIQVGGSNGIIALVQDVTTALGTGACANVHIVDLIGFGTGGTPSGPPSCYEGQYNADLIGAAQTLSNTQAATRNQNGCQDNNRNRIDFSLTSSTGVPVPRNSATPANLCGLSSTGTCCNTDGTCFLIYNAGDAAACSGAGGTTINPAVTCFPNPCALGTCCNTTSGTCTFVISLNCGAGNAWTVGGSCTPTNTCPQPQTGVCCLLNGSCNVATPGIPNATCTLGTLVVNGTCNPSPCAPPPGVCCRGATCTTAYITSGDCGLHTTTASTGGPGWAFVSSSSVCNAGVAADGNYTGALTSTLTPCCFANYNHSANGLEVQDIFDFLNDWFAGNPLAIPGGDGTSTTGLAVQNIFNFLNAWFAGGCS